MRKKMYPKETNLNEDEQAFEDDNAAARLIYASTFKVLLLRNILQLKYEAGAKKNWRRVAPPPEGSNP